jgi:hypothetical protein
VRLMDVIVRFFLSSKNIYCAFRIHFPFFFRFLNLESLAFNPVAGLIPAVDVRRVKNCCASVHNVDSYNSLKKTTYHQMVHIIMRRQMHGVNFKKEFYYQIKKDKIC